MPRSIAYRFKGEPTDEARPVGMNDIVGSGDYMSEANAVKFLRRAFMRYHNAPHHRGQGYTKVGVYTWPSGYRDPMRLVGAFPI